MVIADLDKALAEYRAKAEVRRAGAFTNCPEYVVGISLRPVTLETHRMLKAINSPYIRGETALEGDVRNFIWFHSRWFTTWRLFAKPLRWFALLPFNALLHGRPGLQHYAAVIAMASNDISRILTDTFADVPAADTSGPRMAPGASIEAQLVHLFLKHYGWPESRTRKTPLRQLFQFMRCICPGEDAGEQEIKVAYLKARNAELAQAAQK